MNRDEAVAYLKEKVAEDEPVFILRGQDILAPAVIRVWAELAEIVGSPAHKVETAMFVAEYEFGRQINSGKRIPD